MSTDAPNPDPAENDEPAPAENDEHERPRRWVRYSELRTEVQELRKRVEALEQFEAIIRDRFNQP